MISALILLSLNAGPVMGFDKARLDLIPVRMGQFVTRQEIGGVVTMVQRNGKAVFYDAQGAASLEPRRQMTKGTVFQVMSMTKPVTVSAVMICAERGLLNLDDPVSMYLPGFRNLRVFQPDGTTRAVKRTPTIRHLLTHTSGLSGNDPGGLDDESKAKLTLADYAARYGSEPLDAEPGERICYSGPGITAAGRIVELVTKQKFEDFLQTEVFDKLGMKDTWFFAPRDAEPRIAHFLESQSGGLKDGGDPTRPGSKFANPAGGLYSTAEDMARFIQMFVDGGRGILSRRSVAAMTTLQTGNLLSDGSDMQGYGLGFSVIRNPGGNASLRPQGSFGHNGAFGTEYWADPKTKTVVVYMSQSFNDRPRKAFNTMVNAAFVGP